MPHLIPSFDDDFPVHNNPRTRLEYHNQEPTKVLKKEIDGISVTFEYFKDLPDIEELSSNDDDDDIEQRQRSIFVSNISMLLSHDFIKELISCLGEWEAIELHIPVWPSNFNGYVRFKDRTSANDAIKTEVTVDHKVDPRVLGYGDFKCNKLIKNGFHVVDDRKQKSSS